MINFQRTAYGRLINFFLILSILNLNSCTIYKASETNLETIRTTEQITNNLDVYKFFVHDNYNSYLLTHPVFNPDGSVSGQLTPTNYTTPDSTWSQNEKKAYWDDHKYDINIYSNKEFSNLKASSDVSTNLGISQTVTISGEMIEKMTITSVDKEKELAAAAIVLLAILGILVAIVLMIVLISVTAEASSDGSAGSSDGSGSNSNSGSGGSGSGSS